MSNNIFYLCIYGQLNLQIEAVKVFKENIDRKFPTWGDSCQDSARDNIGIFAVRQIN